MTGSVTRGGHRHAMAASRCIQKSHVPLQLALRHAFHSASGAAASGGGLWSSAKEGGPVGAAGTGLGVASMRRTNFSFAPSPSQKRACIGVQGNLNDDGPPE